VLVLAANIRPLIGITVLGVATVQVTDDRARRGNAMSVLDGAGVGHAG